jgi:DNA topoisomerase I
MNIVIVESPAKSKTIEKYLGKDFKVMASFGHVRDLPSKNGSVDTDNDFNMNYKVSPQSEKVMKDITKAVKAADKLYLATDPDREGEAISWHVLEELKHRIKDMDKKEVYRIQFNEITKTAVKHAVANPRELAMDMIDAQQARRALDYLVGFNLSPVLWRKVRTGLSAGRVQSVALRLVCEREDAIEAFNPEEYWSMEADFATPSGDTILSRLVTLDGVKQEKFSINNEKDAKAAEKSLNGLDYSVKSLKKKQVQRRPFAPFITSTLQIDASRKLRFSAKKTMSVAQRLYEAGLITYMRTDSVVIAQEAITAVRDTISNMYGADYVPENPNFYKTKSQNAQEAHEAIRPTDFNKLGKDLKLEDDQFKLYELIWKRTVSSQMAPAKLDQTSLTIADTSGKNEFRASGSIIVFAGFLKAYQVAVESGDSTDKDKLLPSVTEADIMDLKKLMPEQHFTEPPPRYSEATLVKALEENGIGRPSTYASIISTIQDRGYVSQEKRRLTPEDVGRIVNKFLVEHFSKYVDLGFTADMENTLDEISRGEKKWKPVLEEFWSPFKTQIDDKIESVQKKDVTTEKTGEKCPTCGKGELLIRLGRYGKFKGCDQYPECKHIENIGGKNDAPKEPPKSTGIKCPQCDTNDILERKSRRGKIFYGCGGYPKCKYALWNKPIEEPCPSCGNSFITMKETKRDGVTKICPNEECGWQDPPAKEKKAKAPAKKKAVAKKKAPAKKKTIKKKAS